MDNGLKICKACGKEIGIGVKKCVHCGTDQRNWIMKHKFLTIVGILICLGMIGSFFNEGNTLEKTAVLENNNTLKEDIEVNELKLEKGEYNSKSVIGILKNNTSTEYKYVQVEINLYDASGIQVGSTMANINNLESNGTWKFEAPVLEENVVTAKLKEITKF